MADLNDLGDIKEGFEHISELLDIIRTQNTMKTGDWDKVLSNINLKLEDLSNDENADLIKVFLAEIKRTLDERHNFVASKFSEIEREFKVVEEKAGSGIKADEMRQIFDIIATNLTIFSKEVVAQKDVLSDITLRIDDIKNDDSQKRDILRNISVVKVELEKFNNGFESIVLNLSDNFKAVGAALLELDSKESLKALKSDIENIYLSSNAVLSALQVIDRKNRELEGVITHLVSKEDFTLEREQVAKLIAQNIQLTDYISTLADKVGVENLNQKMDTAVGIINAMKNVLQDSSNQNQQMLIAQLERLESAVATIISEEDFVKFRNELYRLVEEGAQSSNLVRAELLDTNAELRNLFNFLNSFEIKSNFQQLSGLVKNTEDNVKASVWELSGKIAQEGEKNKTLITTDINGNIQTVSQKLDLAEENIKEAAKSNLSTVLENIQSVINNIFAVKNEIHIDNLESVDAIETKFQDLKSNIANSKDAIVKGSQAHFENLLTGLNSVFKKIDETKEGLDKNSQSNLENITSEIGELSQKLDLTTQGIGQSVQDNLGGVTSGLEGLSQKLDSATQDIGKEVGQKIQEGLSDVTSGIGELAQKIDNSTQNISQNLQANLSDVTLGLDELALKLSVSTQNISQNVQNNLGGVNSGIDELSHKIDAVSQNINQNIQNNQGGLTSGFEDLSQKLDATGQNINQNLQENLEGIVSTFDTLSEKMDLTKQSFSQDLKFNLDGIVSNFEELSKKIDGTKHVLSQKSQEDLNMILGGVEKLSKELVDTREGITHSAEANFSNVLMIVEKFSSEMSQLKDSLNQSSEVGWAETKSSIDETIQGLKSIKGEMALNLSENTTGIKSEIENLFTALESAKDNLKDNSQSNFENILVLFDNLSKEVNLHKEHLSQNVKSNVADIAVGLHNLSIKIEESNASLNSNIKGDIAELQEAISALPENIKEIQAAYQESSSAAIEQNSRTIEELSIKIQSLTKGIITKDNPFKEIVTYEFAALKELLTTIQAELAQSDLNVGDDINNNIHHLEDLIVQNSDSYDVGLFNLQAKLVEYLQFIQDKTQESTLKLDASAGQVLEIKSDVQSVLESVSMLTSDSRFADLSSDISQKFEEILINVTQLEEVSASKTQSDLQVGLQDSLQQTLNVLDEQFTGVYTKIESFKNTSGSDLNDAFSQLTEKINGLKGHIGTVKADLADALNSRVTEIVNGFAPVQETIEKLGQVDFQDIIEQIKDQLEESRISLDSAIKDELNDSRFELSDKITDTYAAIDNRLDKIQQDLIENHADGVSDLKIMLQNVLNVVGNGSDNAENNEFLTAQLSKVEKSIISDSSKKIENLETVLKTVLRQLEDLAVLPEKIETSLAASKTELPEDTFDTVVDKLSEKIEETQDKLILSQEELKASLLKGLSDNVSFVKSAVEDINSVPEKIEESIIFSKNALSTSISEKIEDAENALFAGQEQIKTSLINGFDENVSLIRDNLEELVSVKSDLLEEISSVKNLIQDENSNQIIHIKNEMDGLVEEVTRAQESLASYKLDIADLFKIQDGEVKEQISLIENAIIGEISRNVTKFKTAVQETSEQIESKISLSEENYKNSAESLLVDIKASFYEKVEDGLDDLKSFLEVLENKNDAGSIVEKVKTEIFEKFSSISDTVETTIAAVSVKGDLEEFSKEIEVSVSDLLESLYDRISIALDDNKLTQEVLANSEEVQRRIEDLKNLVTEDVSQKLEAFQQSLDKQAEDFSNLVSEVKVSINDLKENYVDLSINSSMEISSILSAVQEKIESIDTKLSGCDFQSIIDSSRDQIFNEINSVRESISGLDMASKIEELSQKIENVSGRSEGDFESDLREIKESIQTQSQFIEDLKALEQLEKLSKIDGVIEAQQDIKNIIWEFENKLNDITELQIGDKEQANSVIDDLNTMKREIVESVLNVFDQISFVVEAEDIKDFVEVKSQEIKQTIKSSLGNNFAEIKKHIQILQSGSEEELSGYSYSLQDIESDIAKVRVILDEISKTKTNQDLGQLCNLEKLSDLDKLNDLTKLNEDIMSISTRTNKLLLTSDESSITLKENLGEFRNIVYQLEEKVRHLDNTENNKRIEKKLEDINNLVLTGVKSDKTFNQAFMYLAGWVDSADENISSILEKVSDIEEIKHSVAQLQKTSPEKADAKAAWERIVDKFEQQQEKIEMLEEKIDMLLSKKTKPSADIDIRSIVEEVLAQAGEVSPAAKSDAKLSKKVDSIDKQLVKLSKSIEKITSYVDEG